MLNLAIGECTSLVGVELDILDKKVDLEEDSTGTVLNRYCKQCELTQERDNKLSMLWPCLARTNFAHTLMKC